LKRLKQDEERKKEEEERREEEEAAEESEEETAFDSLLGVIGGKKGEDNSDEEGEDEEEEEEEEDVSDNEGNDDINENEEETEFVKSNGVNDNDIATKRASSNAKGDVIDDDDDDDDDEDAQTQAASDVKDSFLLSFQTDVDEQHGESFKSSPSYSKSGAFTSQLGAATAFNNAAFNDVLKDVDALLDGFVRRADDDVLDAAATSSSTSSWEKLLKPQMTQRVSELLPKALSNQTDGERDSLTPMQKELLALCLSYKDVCFCDRNLSNGEDVRFVYSLHALNHVIKSNRRVINNNNKIKVKRAADPSFDSSTLELRDSGLVRPKVLIVVPFRDSALKIVNILVDAFIAKPAKETVAKKAKFLVEYGDDEKGGNKKGNPDFLGTFGGNVDDHFRIGISVSRASMKLFAPIYSSDIIIASPLGIRTAIGVDGDSKSDHDFLTSIELLILDQCDVFMMQNWDHVDQLFQHMHLQPKVDHGCDFSRVRNWSLNGFSSIYRQSLVFSRFPSMEISSIFNKKCQNFRGKFLFQSLPEIGSIQSVLIQVPQKFHRFHAAKFSDQAEVRFQYFISQLMPKLKDSMMAQTLIFVPSYFDFVRLRNYFRSEEISFAQICEYSKDSNVSRARNRFSHKTDHFLLYTERFHFYHRIFVRGIKHLVFYQLPSNPHFYSELVNFMSSPTAASVSHLSVSVLFSHFDALRLSSVVGTARSKNMVAGGGEAAKRIHTFVTGKEG